MLVRFAFRSGNLPVQLVICFGEMPLQGKSNQAEWSERWPKIIASGPWSRFAFGDICSLTKVVRGAVRGNDDVCFVRTVWKSTRVSSQDNNTQQTIDILRYSTAFYVSNRNCCFLAIIWWMARWTIRKQYVRASHSVPDSDSDPDPDVGLSTEVGQCPVSSVQFMFMFMSASIHYHLPICSRPALYNVPSPQRCTQNTL